MWNVYVRRGTENHYSYEDQRATRTDAMRRATHLMSQLDITGVMVEESD